MVRELQPCHDAMRGLSLIALSFALALTTACVGELIEIDPGAGGGGGGGADAGTVNQAGKNFYDTNIAPMMISVRPKGTCASCHAGTDAINGPDFLGTTIASGYQTLMANTRLVNTTTPASSVLITRGDHTGDAWCSGPGTPYAACTEDEIGIINQWIALEAQ